MTKILDFPKWATKHTYEEAIKAMLDETPASVKDSPVTNLLIIGFHKDDYNFGMLNTGDLRTMIGTMECVKSYFIEANDVSVEGYDRIDD